MPLVITLAHQKGGVGKSTLASNLRSYFSQVYKTALVDIDPQGSLAKLAKAFAEQKDRESEHVISRTDFDSFEELREKISSYDVVIIDTPPYLSSELESVFALSNIIIIPTKTSPLDFLAIGDTMELIKTHQQNNQEVDQGEGGRWLVSFSQWLLVVQILQVISERKLSKPIFMCSQLRLATVLPICVHFSKVIAWKRTIAKRHGAKFNRWVKRLFLI